jgi:hypothetical protein
MDARISKLLVLSSAAGLKTASWALILWYPLGFVIGAGVEFFRTAHPVHVTQDLIALAGVVAITQGLGWPLSFMAKKVLYRSRIVSGVVCLVALLVACFLGLGAWFSEGANIRAALFAYATAVAGWSAMLLLAVFRRDGNGESNPGHV